ncbi:unnamed protein product [Brassica napus]|uniref:(rape) hypothetical protein n=1 Tax=Brassica napus TaxID=3708 RepID=A0A816Z170_BRANA|nr:unnamed protein product [Brassica napus]
MWTRVQPAYAANMWNNAPNKNLVAQNWICMGFLKKQ